MDCGSSSGLLEKQLDSTTEHFPILGPMWFRQTYVTQHISQSSILRCGIHWLQNPKRLIRHCASSITMTGARHGNVSYSLVLFPAVPIIIQTLHNVQKCQAPEHFYGSSSTFWSTWAYQGIKRDIMFFLLLCN